MTDAERVKLDGAYATVNTQMGVLKTLVGTVYSINKWDNFNSLTTPLKAVVATMQNQFFSHRRSFQEKKLPTGRMINIIAFRESS